MNQTVYVVQEIGLNGVKVVGVYSSHSEAREGVLGYKDSNGQELREFSTDLEWVDENSLVGMSGMFSFQILERVLGATYHGKSLSDSQEVLTLGPSSS